MQRMNPKQMRKMMERMGIQQEEIDANIVLIKSDDKEIIITNPRVVKVNMMGQDTFQISGNISERAPELEIDDADVETVMEQAQVDRETAFNALKHNQGDMAKTILELTSEEE
ncbi:nascent polypeptide-associated complex protein [Candidatus Woesearchaeota archaeon]|nr:nascent polypeptide-associated complex protein [Candidatus Woesearchaeota archaeon]